MHIFVAIDSFKGSMTSKEANEAVRQALPNDSVETFQIADGGEGTVHAFVDLLKGGVITSPITGPNGEIIEGKFGWIEKEKLAIIEVAEGAGITKVDADSLDPKKHTSFGVGEQIISALDLDAKEIIVGLGGSATVDGGIGLMQALGVVFKDQFGSPLPLLPIDLGKVETIDVSNLDRRLNEVKITVASDVTNPLCGKEGATYIFGPQKGLMQDELPFYDQMMYHYQKVVNRETGTSKHGVPGAGAAGGIGFALYSFLDATFQSGFSLLADKGNLAKRIENADVVITGEGKFDRQSMQGKVPIGISRIAKKKKVPTIVFAGSVEDDLFDLKEENIVAIIPIVDQPMLLNEAMQNGQTLLTRAVQRTFHLLNLQL